MKLLFAVLALTVAASLACSSPEPTSLPATTPTATLIPSATPEPTATPYLPPPSLPPNTGAWVTWGELKDLYPSPTGPHIYLEATDHTGKRNFGLQVVCWPIEDGDLEERRLAVMVAEIFTDPDMIAAMRMLSSPPGYHPMEIDIDGESPGVRGWLLGYEEGPVDAYYYSEIFTATADTSKEVVEALVSPSARELTATLYAGDVSDSRVFNVEGSDEALKPVLEACLD